MPSTLAAELRCQTERLARCKIDSPRLSAELLLAEALGISRQSLLKELVLTPDAPLSPSHLDAFHTLIDRRAAGEPAAYILGRKEFYGRDFLVTPDTLIPRPETELLVETALHEAATLPSPLHFADLGTGSGCIAVTVGLELPGSSGIALDKSVGALTVAAENARRLGCSTVLPVQGDFLAPPLGRFSLVLSNPPYVSEPEYGDIEDEVRLFEPKSALVPEDGSSKGMEAVAAIADRAQDLLLPGGRLVMEIGCSQGGTVERLLRDIGWQECAILKDLAGLDRVVRARKPD